MPIAATNPPTPCLLFLSLLKKNEVDFESIYKHEAHEIWGHEYNSFSPQLLSMNSYYEKEMGGPLTRTILCFKTKHSNRDVLISAKKWAMAIEEKYSHQGKRPINIDPGILCLEQVLLISTKPYSHRIHLKDNLYAELTYLYNQGNYTPLSWTYPDYADQNTRDFFKGERDHLLKNLKD